MRTYLGLLTNAVRSALRSKHYLMLENLALRQLLAVLTRQRARTQTKPADRLFWSWLSRYWPGWRSTLVIVQPETVIRWHRTAWGAVRIQGELLALGYEVSAETVRCYRRRALRRPPSQSRRTFLANLRPQLWAADFFTVQTLTFKTLYVFFFTHARRRIVHFNAVQQPRYLISRPTKAVDRGDAAFLANLRPQLWPRGCGLLHRADAHLQDAVRLLLH